MVDHYDVLDNVDQKIYIWILRYLQMQRILSESRHELELKRTENWNASALVTSFYPKDSIFWEWLGSDKHVNARGDVFCFTEFTDVSPGTFTDELLLGWKAALDACSTVHTELILAAAVITRIRWKKMSLLQKRTRDICFTSVAEQKSVEIVYLTYFSEH